MQHHFSLAVNDNTFGLVPRGRTVPIPETITSVPGYPRKLVVYKIAASRFWQVRCWLHGKIHKRSTQCQALPQAIAAARDFYDQLVADPSCAALAAAPSRSFLASAAPLPEPAVQAEHSFAVLAARMFAAEEARVERGELARGSLQVLRNRLDAHLLPRWGALHASAVDYTQLMAFVDFMSQCKSSTTIGQYLVAIRKVLNHGVRVGAIAKLPEMPRVKIRTTSRGAFTPSEYWRILRASRALRWQPHPETPRSLRKSYKLVYKNCCIPPDLAWAVGFMVNSFIRPSDLKTLKHRHVEIVKGGNTYLRLTLPETKSHDAPIVTLFPAVRIYRQIVQFQGPRGKAGPEDYLFLPELQDRNYALAVLGLMFNWVLAETGLKQGPHGQDRSLYSLRHSAITFRLLYGQGIDVLTLARNARTGVDIINKHYASSLCAEQNIALLQSRRSRASTGGGLVNPGQPSPQSL